MPKQGEKITRPDITILQEYRECYRAQVYFRRNIEQPQIDDMLAKLITAMTKDGKFKDAIQDKIGATVDTTDMEKQLSVLNESLHQAETIKIRLEQQMGNLDVKDIHYDKKYQIYRDDWILNMIK